MSWVFWRIWELILRKYLTNIYLCWEFALPTSTILSISRYFKRFQLNDLLSQPLLNPKPPPRIFSFLRALFSPNIAITDIIFCISCCNLSGYLPELSVSSMNVLWILVSLSIGITLCFKLDSCDFFERCFSWILVITEQPACSNK